VPRDDVDVRVQDEGMSLKTSVTERFGLSTPIIAGPMFLVSNPVLVSAVSNAGGLGGMPSLNWRSPEAFREAVQEVKRRTQHAFAVNLIVNQSNSRLEADLRVCAEEKVPLVITSLGHPGKVIKMMHEVGSAVFCDVTTLEFAKKAEAQGADGVIAVSSGAGGHAGPISPLVLIPHLRRHLKVPVVLAGGIATGEQMAAALILGASAVQIGTRFIATKESPVDGSYKDAILKSQPEDIVLTAKISGTPASVIKTPYIEREGLELNSLEKFLLKHPRTKRVTKMVRAYLGSRVLEKAVSGTTWKEVWSAGQGVGLIDSIETVEEVMKSLTKACERALKSPVGLLD
jgi:nitronate monooxygenase